MRDTIAKISQSTIVRNVVRNLRLNRLANAWLRRFPLVNKLPGSNIVYRATSLESIPLAVDMFQRGQLYDANLLRPDFVTFADLGCNVGYFTCWLAHLAGERKLRGLMLDANPETLNEARWHARVNELSDVHVIHGIAGERSPDELAEFHVYESNICSTGRLAEKQKLNLKGKWKAIRVPCVSVGEQWRLRFGDTRCHLLKIDIEGSELDFLQCEHAFLRICDAILVEWHKWSVSLDALTQTLQSQGFEFVQTIEENTHAGTAYFVSRSIPRESAGPDVLIR